MKYIFTIFVLLVLAQAARAELIDAKEHQDLPLTIENVLVIKPGATVYKSSDVDGIVIYGLSHTLDNRIFLRHNGRDIIIHGGQAMIISFTGELPIKAHHDEAKNLIDNIYGCNFAISSLIMTEPDLLAIVKTDNSVSRMLIKAAAIQRQHLIGISDDDETPIPNDEFKHLHYENAKLHLQILHLACTNQAIFDKLDKTDDLDKITEYKTILNTNNATMAAFRAKLLVNIKVIQSNKIINDTPQYKYNQIIINGQPHSMDEFKH